MKVYYFVSLGFYSYSIFTLFFETKRKDFVALFVHHIATTLLLALSFVLRFHRFGLVVLLLHDLNDVALEGSKMLKYAKREGGATLGFALFMLSWVVTRFVLFPWRVIYASA